MKSVETIKLIQALEVALKELLKATDVQIFVDVEDPDDILGDIDESLLEGTGTGSAHRKAQ